MTVGEPIVRGDWLEIRRTADNYEYVHQIRMGAEAVAVLGYTSTLVLGRFEVCPAHGDGLEPKLCALTGGIEPEETPVQAAQREMHEESGISLGLPAFRPLGNVRPSKASDTVIHLFGARINVCDLGDDPHARQYGPGDGTEGEKGAFCQLVKMDEALWSKDPLLIAMAARVRGWR